MALRSSLVNEPGTWGVIGGALNTKENVMTAVKREFTEETGCTKSIVMLPAYVFKTSNGSFVYHNFIGLVPKEFDPRVDWETERFEWMTYEQMMKLKSKYHFGLKGLLKDSKSLRLIKKYAK
jgi:ADP-ribose pyrophosphatase YjhB (NUDIX family)